MKTMIYGLLLALSVSQVHAQSHEVLSDGVWVKPKLLGKFQVTEEKTGKNHFLNAEIRVDEEGAKAYAAEMRTRYPGLSVKIYNYTVEEAVLNLPQVARTNFIYSELVDGWKLRLDYLRLPHSGLSAIKELLKSDEAVALKLSFMQKSDKVVKVLDENCAGQTSEPEGLAWFFERLKSFEKSYDRLPTKWVSQKDANLVSFANKCVAYDVDGVKSFKELGTASESTWRFKPKDADFSLTDVVRVETYREESPSLNSQVTIIQY